MIFCARARFALPLFVFLSFGVAPSAEAAVFNVDTFDDELNFDGDCSLREAIQAANLDVGVDGCGIGSGADLIQLPAGNYPLTLTLPGDDDLNQVGDLDIRSDITLRGIGATQSVIDSQVFGGSRVLHVRCSDSLVVDIDVLIENVTLKGGATLLPGAGILIEDCTDGSSTAKSNVEINDVVLQANLTGSYGGGIADQTIGFVTIRNSLFYQNAVFESSFDGPGWAGVYRSKAGD